MNERVIIAHVVQTITATNAPMQILHVDNVAWT